jgi:hypothetical protein
MKAPFLPDTVLIVVPLKYFTENTGKPFASGQDAANLPGTALL